MQTRKRRVSYMKRENPTYDTIRMREDMALRGWMARDLARVAGVSESGVSWFMTRKKQSAKMADKLAKALGYTVRRYLISARERVA